MTRGAVDLASQDSCRVSARELHGVMAEVAFDGPLESCTGRGVRRAISKQLASAG
jgi:hypothetical protein